MVYYCLLYCLGIEVVYQIRYFNHDEVFLLVEPLCCALRFNTAEESFNSCC